MGFLDFLPGIGTLVKGAFGVGGTALGYAYNKKLMQAQQAYNTSEREATQAYNTSEREAAQAYNTGEREAQNAYAEQMYNTYSSPEALVRQYEDAGLNPRLAIGSNTAGSVAASSGHSASVSPQSSGMLGMTPPYQDVNSFSQGFVNIASALKSLADAKKAGMETYQIEQTLAEQLRQYRLSNDAIEFANKLNVKYGDEKQRREIESLIVDIAKGQEEVGEIRHRIDILVQQHRISKYEADKWLDNYEVKRRNMEAATEDLKAGKHLKESESDLNYTNKVVATYRVFEIKQNIKESEAREEFFRNNAGYMQVNKEFIQIQKDILEGSKNQKIAYDKEYWVRQKQNLADLQTQLKIQIELAKKDKDWYNVRALTDILNKTAQTVQTVQAIQYKPAEFLGSFLGN